MKEYNDNIQELKAKKIQLKKLNNEREAIISKYTKTTVSSPKVFYKKVYDPRKKKFIRKAFIDENKDIKGKNKKQEPMLELQIELEESGLDVEIKRIKKEIEEINSIIHEMEEPLSKLKGYGKKVYFYQLKGLSKTKAVERVAEEENVTSITIWRNIRRNK